MATDWKMIAMMAGATGAQALSSSIQAKNARKAQQQENSADRQMSEEQFAKELAFKQSLENPYRQQRSQVTTMGGLDALEQVGTRPSANLSSVPYAQPGMVASMPKLTPQTLMAIQAMRSNIAPGGPGAQGVTGMGMGAAGPTFDAATGGMGRRNEGAGGMMSGAKTGAKLGSVVPGMGTLAGAGIGAVAGAFTKNAQTAATDFSLQDATSVIADGYRQKMGREASPQEIQAQLKAIGWQPGHQWVGEQGLRYIFTNLDPANDRRTA